MNDEENKKEEVDGASHPEVLDEKTNVVEKKNNKKKGKRWIVICLVLFLLIVACCVLYFFVLKKPTESTKVDHEPKKVTSEYRMSGNGLEDFDLYFLKLENEEKNKVYSPLSIKYALAMLQEGASGNSKEQIRAVIGDYQSKKYPNNEHMSFANAMFIRETFKDSIKSSYTDSLKEKYNAEVITDSFTNANPINNWVSNKTLKLIDNLLDDRDVVDKNFFLINALAIDMEWNNQVHCISDHKIPCVNDGRYSIEYTHEKLRDLSSGPHGYLAVDYPYTSEDEFYGTSYNIHEFNGRENIKGGDILADYNRYDIIKELGEDKIRETVRADYEKWLEEEKAKNSYDYEYAEKDVDKFLDEYMEGIKENYGKGINSTDFLLHDDEDVKVFAKDLKTYDGTTLQYVGIMPKTKDLATYIKDLKASDINTVIKNLKEVKIDSFEEGYATRIRGYIPFFKFEYELQLLDDLKEMGIEDVFDEEKSDLSEMTTSEGAYIGSATHKANIEFSNDGIKASAATAMGGYGSTSGGYDYLFEIPTINIDITFDKPYLYLVRDKDTGEVWFTGTVYEPTRR